MSKIENLLQQVSIIQKKYDEIAKITGQNFNIFSVLSVERREVKTHSSFLGELLNPKGSHGLNDAFLKLFIKEVLGDTLVEFESITANAVTEEYIAQINEDKTTGGRVDIVIKDAKGNVILIENKIDAYEQKNQLIRYRNAYPQAKILFLTLTGYDSNTALAVEHNQKDYISISYEIHIVKWLEICLKEAVNYPMLREVIKQYIYLIKKLTNQTINNKMSEEIVKKMENNISESFEIANNIKSLKRTIYYDFIETLMKSNELKFDNCTNNAYYGIDVIIKNNKRISILFGKNNDKDDFAFDVSIGFLIDKETPEMKTKYSESRFTVTEWWIYKRFPTYNYNSNNWTNNIAFWEDIKKGTLSDFYKDIKKIIEEIIEIEGLNN